MSHALLCSCYAMGHQPLMLALAQGALREAGFTTSVLDTRLDAVTPEKLQGHKLVAIAVPMHTALRLGVELGRQVKAHNPGAVLCFFGLYAPLNRQHLFESGADVVLGPEFAEALVGVARASESGRSGLTSLRGMAAVWLRDQDSPLQPSRPGGSVVDRAGFHALSKYTGLLAHGEERVVGYTEATRGCKHRCLHCPLTPVYQGRFFAVDRDVVLNDVDTLVAGGAKHITFGDPDFLNGPTHAVKLAEELHRRHPHVTWDATIKVEHILAHASLFPRFRELGCLFIVSAVESLSDTVLRHLDKGHTGEDVGRALHILKDAGITLRPTLLAFTPWTTAADYLRVCDFLDVHALHDQVDAVQLAVRLLIPPGSALLPHVESEPWLGPLDPHALTYTWTHPDVRMDALCREVGDVVAAGATSGDDPVVTLRRVMALARERLGVQAVEHPPLPHAERAPRLTEHWFC